jgi:hypothetical protein
MFGGDRPFPCSPKMIFLIKNCMETYLEAIDIGVSRTNTQGIPKPKYPTNLIGDEIHNDN